MNKKLKMAIKQRGLTYRFMANWLEMTETSFTNKINCHHKTRFSKCEKYCLAAIFNLKPNEIE